MKGSAACRPDLGKVPRLLLDVRHLLTVEELRVVALLIVHHAARLLSIAAQRPQVQQPLPRVTSQLEGNMETE